ncbi:sugar ABC transporter permease [Mycoplasma zalophidermidis]|uniref:Sugar ABC transporter permease n=1 Tax=Mycoplasma zalophidermidis TaxID=398174 RepID=A0ABS6DTR4_9MOLU|nr:ABC transporter permease [Mycoplasma zalophidermidis]MBU4693829.1 sugar ABC transporter permease [Mycoplasma zalophidermidis]
MIKRKNIMIEALSKISEKMSSFVKMDKTKSTGRKVASSLWALFFGIVLSLVYIFLKTSLLEHRIINPFAIFTNVVDSLKSPSNKEVILNYLLIFGFSSLACAISFKAGLFNIGIPGQMMITGATSFGIFIKLGYTSYTSIPVWLLLLALVFSMIFAFIAGLIAGVLKAYLNVHEVISTIMINWIIVGIAMVCFQQKSANVIWPEFSLNQISYYFNDVNTGTNPGIVGISQEVKKAFSIAGLVILLVLVIAVAFVFSFTSLGYKIRMQGMSKSNGKYMGVNDKKLTMLVLAFSAMIAGVAGFFNYVLGLSARFDSVTQPLNLGFECIAISLLALNSPIGIIFTSLFYTALYTANYKLQKAPLYLKPDDVQVITSMILYLAATAIMFTQFKPIVYFRGKFALLSDPRYKAYSKLKRYNIAIAKLNARNKTQNHNARYTVSTKNADKTIAKLNLINQKYLEDIAKLESKIVIAKFELQQAQKLNDLINQKHAEKMANYSQLNSAILDAQNVYYNKLEDLNNPELNYSKDEIKLQASAVKVALKEQIKSLKAQYVSPNYNSELKQLRNENKALVAEFTKNENEALNQRLSTIKADEINWEINEVSNKNKVSLLNREFVKLQDKYLADAMNYKNTDEQTLVHFEQINLKKYELINQMKELGKTGKFAISQQRTADLKSIYAEYAPIFADIIDQRLRMALETLKKKEVQDGLNT